MRYGESGPHEMNELVMDSTHTTFLISRRTTFRKGVPRLPISVCLFKMNPSITINAAGIALT